MRHLIATVSLAFAMMVSPLAAGFAAEPPAKRTVSVTGTGIAKARPDMASVSLGVVSEGDNAREALDKNNAAMSRVIVELKTHEIDPKDIQTANFAVHPKYQHFKDGKPPVIIGYRVVNSVGITVRNLEKLGPILDQAVSDGSNQINGIEFSIENASALEDEARKKAMADARHKAGLYAAAGNARLGPVLTISETLVSEPPRPLMRNAVSEASAASVPIEAGEHEVKARVQVSWELKD